MIGKTAIRTLMGPAYQKLKKVPPVTSEDEAIALMVKILPLYVSTPMEFSFQLSPGNQSMAESILAVLSSSAWTDLVGMPRLQPDHPSPFSYPPPSHSIPPLTLRGSMTAPHSSRSSVESLWLSSCSPESCSHSGPSNSASEFGTSVLEHCA